MKKFLFLYTELPDYFLVCAEALAKTPAEVLIIHWPVNPEAPFQLSERKGLRLVQKDSISNKELIKLIQEFSPDCIYCSGWIDKDYLAIVKSFNVKIPAILGLDNHWKGTLKQKIASIGFKTRLKKYFSHCWIPGKPQYKYATHLGFEPDKILQGFYSADVQRFNELGDACAAQKEIAFPKRFIYVGRYYEFKGVLDLWKAYTALKQAVGSDWELWCLGVGDISGPEIKGLKHFGFVQPADIGKFISDTGVFILPSKKEPWGVVVHEFAAAGFPLLLSHKVGAASAFLQDGVNGFSFSDEHTLLKRMVEICGLDAKQLKKMGEESRKLAATITPQLWASTLINVVPIAIGAETRNPKS